MHTQQAPCQQCNARIHMRIWGERSRKRGRCQSLNEEGASPRRCCAPQPPGRRVHPREECVAVVVCLNLRTAGHAQHVAQAQVQVLLQRSSCLSDGQGGPERVFCEICKQRVVNAGRKKGFPLA